MKPVQTEIPVYKGKEIDRFLKKIESGRTRIPPEVLNSVRNILDDVRERGDEAVFDRTLEFDRVDIRMTGLKVGRAEMDRALHAAPKSFLSILEEAASNIRRFHEKDKPISWMEWEDDGVVLGKRAVPIDRVGIYVPGGRAAYPSSLLMAAIPAQVAGVRDIVLVSPPDPEGRVHPSVLCAASALGLGELYRIGGAQAVGALAFGTRTIRAVDKIVGPGNAYVAEAKRQVYGTVGIDTVAGPSEVVLLADGAADPVFAAADLLAQAEHDPSASSICVTHSKKVTADIRKEVRKQALRLARKTVIDASLRDWGGILLTESIEESISLINRLAPEHLGLHVSDPWSMLQDIRHAGAIFMGPYAPETVGDYWAGPNHILPTNRSARFSSPLGTADFMKQSSIIHYTKSGLNKNGRKIITFARTEGLDGHAEAVRRRIE